VRWLLYLDLPAASILLVFYLFNTVSLLRYFLRSSTTMIKKKITGDELSAHAKVNDYQCVRLGACQELPLGGVFGSAPLEIWVISSLQFSFSLFDACE
jgi:hypothetical protein